MKMWTRCALKIVMIFKAVFLIAESSKVKYSYFTVGQTVFLKCTDGALKLHSAVWAGPAQNGIRKGAPISVTEVDGKRNKWNVSQYTDDGRVLSSLLHRNRLTVIGSYDLQIVNTSTLDEGLYMCYLGPIEVFSRIILKIKTLPSNMTFANVTKEKILHGKVNTTLHIICSVQDGIPDLLSIKRNNNTVKSVDGSTLEYSLLPTRLDHSVNYTCEARSSLLKQPLKKIIHLDIKYRPVVSSTHDGIQEIKKGTSHTLCCYVDSNPIPTSTRWMNGSQEILVTHYVTETCFILRNVSQYDQGNYTCIAYNIVGNGSVTIVLQVTSNTSSVKKSLLFPGIIILVLMITIAFITPGIALIVHFMRQMHKKRTVPSNDVQKPEGSEEESADYTEIAEGYNLHTTSQENDNPVISAATQIGVRNKVASIVSVENASTSLDNGSNVSENVDDDYEHPYNTLIADIRDNHAYVTIKGNPNYENSHPFENAACGRFIDKNRHKIKKV